MAQVLQPLELHGITIADIEDVVTRTVQNFIQRYKSIPKVIWFDTSYLYTFDLNDFEYVRKFNLRGRTDIHYVLEWHRNLERFIQDQTVQIFGRRIKPRQIGSTFDRVPNEGLVNIASSFTGHDFNIMKWHAIGTGATAGTNPPPSATQLVTQVDRIDVTVAPQGGSLSQEGSTIFVVGNHPISTASGSYTETGLFDSENTALDKMGDYSIFPDEIDHDANQDAIGSTTVIFQCST